MTPSRIASIAVAVGLLLALAAACGSDAEPTSIPTAPTAAPADTATPAPPTAAPAQPIPTETSGEVAAEIANFTHVDLTVPVGTTVRWTNLDAAIHTTTAGEPGSETGTWDSGRLSSGQFFSFTFNEAGTFAYFCQIHPGSMRATVTVTGAGAAAAPTAEAAVVTPTPTPAPTTAPSGPTPTTAAAQPTPTAIKAPAQPTATDTPTAIPPPPPPPPPQPAATATTAAAAAQPTATATPPAPTATAEPTATAIPTATTEAAQSVEIVASKDNTLYENANGSISSGCGEFMYVGRTNNGSLRRGILQFDVAGSLPPGATVVSASLKLRVTRTQADSQTIAVHRLLAGWGEGSSTPSTSGGGSGGPAADGDATWLHTFFDTATWASPGGDFASEASAEKAVAGEASWRWSSDQMVTDVQGWLDDPESNYGWILVGNESTNQTTKKFASRENGNEDHHPVLTVEFTGGGAAPAAAAAPACSGGAGPSDGSGSSSGSGGYS